MNSRLICGVFLCVSYAVLAASSVIAQPSGVAGKTLEELVARLQDADFKVRQEVLGYIGSMKPYPKEIAPHVIRALQDSNFNVRASASQALGNLQNFLPDLGTQFPECIPRLASLLSDHDPQDQYQLVRRHAAYALRHLGASAKSAVPDLLKVAVNKNDDPSVRTEAVQALGSIGNASPEVVSALVELLDEPAGTNASRPTIASEASRSLARFKGNPEAVRAFMLKLTRSDEAERTRAAAALGSAGFGSPEVEKTLLKLLDDKSIKVQKAALSSLEKANETYAFFFHNNVVSNEVYEKQRTLMGEIKADADRRMALAKISAAQIRFGEGFHPRRVSALHRLVELDVREYLPMLREIFTNLEKKSLYLEPRDLRMQLLITLAAWMPEKESVSFLMGVNSDADEAPPLRFRSAVLLCERGDTESVAYLASQHFEKAAKSKPLITNDELQKSLKDRQRFHSNAEFAELKEVEQAELVGIQKGIQLAEYLYSLQQRAASRVISVGKIRVRGGKIERIHFNLSVPSEWWEFDLVKKSGLWLPVAFRMVAIE